MTLAGKFLRAFAGAVLAVWLASLGATWVQHEVVRGVEAERDLTTQRAAWEREVDTLLQSLGRAIQQESISADWSRLATLELEAIGALLRDRLPALAGFRVTRLELSDATGTGIAGVRAGSTAIAPVPVLDTAAAAQLADVSAPPHRLGGITQDADRHYVIFEARRLPTPQGELTLAATADLASMAGRFEAGQGKPAQLVDLRDRPIGPAIPALEAAPDVRLPPLNRPVITVDTARGPLRLVATPVVDASGRLIARLVTATPASVSVADITRWTVPAVVLIVGLLALAALRWVLVAGLEPGHRLVDVAGNLAAGRLGDAIVDPSDADGARLAGALRQVSARLATLRMLEVSRDKQGRRQRRFIRAQMTKLAETLEAQARGEVEADLARLETGAGQAEGASADGSEFTLLAAAFQNMATRIREQYDRLDATIRDLNEALISKNAFEKLNQELATARRIQLSILPQEMLGRSGDTVQGRIIPARAVGGDFYDFFPIDEHRIGVVMADVSGKGIPAAFFMLITRTLLRATALFGISPAVCLARVNALLAAENEEMMFVTVLYGVLDQRTGAFTYANGGHNPPVLLHEGGRAELLDARLGMALAVIDDAAFEEATVMLAPGDLILLYTDGITEAFAPDGTEYGDKRLLDVTAACARLSTWEVPDAVIAAVKTFEAGGEQADDITCLAVGYRREPIVQG